MADITQFTGGGDVIQATGAHFTTRLVTEMEYNAIIALAPAQRPADFATTLYYITA